MPCNLHRRHTADGGVADISPPTLQADWQDECSQSSHTTSATVLQIPTNGSAGSAQEIRPELRCPPSPVGRQQGGTSLVGYTNGSLERKTREPEMVIESDASTKGWGATCQGSDTGGPWSDSAHQLPSGHPGLESIRKRQNEAIKATQA